MKAASPWPESGPSTPRESEGDSLFFQTKGQQEMMLGQPSQTGNLTRRQFLVGKPTGGLPLDQLLRDAPSEKLQTNARILMGIGLFGGLLFGLPLILIPVGAAMNLTYRSQKTKWLINTGQTTKEEVARNNQISTLVLFLAFAILAFFSWRIIETNWFYSTF